jgi:CHASE2 domain-containing sensor protein
LCAMPMIAASMKSEKSAKRVSESIIRYIEGKLLLNVFCQGQPQKDIILVTVRNDRSELVNVIKFLNTNNPELICVNIDLSECDQRKPRNLIPDTENHEHYFDSLAVRSVIYPSEAEKKLSRELDASRSLLMQSEIHPMGTDAYASIVNCCNFLYSETVDTGFINLVSNEDIANQVEKFQVSLIDAFSEVSYHFAAKIAFALNTEKTPAFIKSHDDTVKIDFDKERKFTTYSFDDFAENKVSGKVLNGKVVIIGVGQPGDYFLVRKKKGKIEELRKMSTSEIFANIACQIIGE